LLSDKLQNESLEEDIKARREAIREYNLLKEKEMQEKGGQSTTKWNFM